jgi:hypothetical protein
MGNRALAHIEKVKNIVPVYYEGNPAEKVEMVQVLDFLVMAQRGEFKIGDLAVFIEVDSIVPEKPIFEFLRAKKFTIKAMKMGAKFSDTVGNRIISQGILFKPSEVLENIEIVEGLDVTAQLGVLKVIEDIEEDASLKDTKVLSLKTKIHRSLMKKSWYRYLNKLYVNMVGSPIKGVWADWMPVKSDEVNIQNIFTRLKNKFGDSKGWIVTEKMEGQNMSVYRYTDTKLFGLIKNRTNGVCTHSRNLITDDGSQFWKTAKKIELIKKLNSLNHDYFIRGEHCGPGIQKNIYDFKDYKFFVFEIYDIENSRLLTYDETIEICNKIGLDFVPVLDLDYQLPNSAAELLEYATAASKHNPKRLREGVVLRRRDNPLISVKARSPRYLAGDKTP